MQSRYGRKILEASLVQPLLVQLSLVLVFFCAFARADVGQRAPGFAAHTLNGSTFTNASLRGSVVLLQFWETWCPHCRDDEAAVDEVERKFAGQGLVVLAIDEGEPEAAVEKYLGKHPRSAPIVLDEHRQIGRRFGKHGYPYYVVIDRRGRIAGTQRGAAGEEALLYLLTQADFPEPSGLQAGMRSSPRSSPPASDANAAGKMIPAVGPGQARLSEISLNQTVSNQVSLNQAGSNQVSLNQAGDKNQAGQAKPEQSSQASGMKVIEVPSEATSPAHPPKGHRRRRAAERKHVHARETGVGERSVGEKKQAGGRAKAGGQNQAATAKANEAAAPQPSGMKMIEVPSERSSHPARALPKTVFVLTSGERVESDQYTMDRHFVHAMVDGRERTIAIGALDVPATEAANRERGVEVKIPNNSGEVFVSF